MKPTTKSRSPARRKAFRLPTATAFAALPIAERTAWLAGWEKGLAEKIATGRINPLVGTDENARSHFAQGN